LQSPGSISDDRTTSNVAEPRPGAAERSVLRVAALAPSEAAGAALEGRSTIADPSERLPADAKSPLKGPVPGRPGRPAPPRPPLSRHFERDPIPYVLETDWLAGHIGLELPNPCANYLFEVP
jgi:hypothetical protein